MDAVRVATHPLLTDPILYLADPPKRIQWTHLEEVFSPCGTIFNAGKSSVHGNSKRKKWIVRFHTVFLAEMALATLQGAVVANSGPPWTMVISHSPTLEPALPTHRIFPQFVKTYGTAGHIGDESPQTVFRWFRRAGPLVSVRTNVNVGYPERVIVVEYWNEDDANWARMEKNALHEGMQHRPAFILRTYDPCSLYCAGMGAGCTDDDLVDAFIEFGHFRDATVKGASGAYGFVSFQSRNSAATAMHVMNGALIRNRTITVRYYEPIAQDVFWSHFSSIGTPPIHRSRPNSPESESTSGRSSPEVAAQNVEDAEAERRRQEDIAQAIREAAERREKEAAAAAKEAAEAKAKKQEERRRRKEEAERAEAAARQALDAAMAEETSAGLEHMEARVTLSEVNSEMLKARMTCVEAKKAWENAEKVHAEVEKRLNEALGSMEEALQKKLLVQARRKAAEEEEARLRAAREAIEKEDREQETDEETLRQAELAESIRKMQELRLVEEAEREEREKRQREAALAEEERLKREREARAREVAERLAREREEAERMAREQREREEQQKRDAENRQRLYEQAAATERVRCQGRDLKFIFWNDQRALERFLLVSDEFDSIKFEESRPLIFENVPWPVLDPPYCQIIASIEWGAVEKFFNAMEKLLRNDKEYKALLEKTHRRFHPDKWRARGILNSVPDQGLRDRLEAAGNIVAQAITPLWRSRR